MSDNALPFAKSLRGLLVPALLSSPLVLIPAVTTLAVGSSSCIKIPQPEQEIDAGGPIGSSIAGRIYTLGNASTPSKRLAGVRAGLAMAERRAEEAEATKSSGRMGPTGRDSAHPLKAMLASLPEAARQTKHVVRPKALEWMPGEMVTLMDHHAIPRDEIADHVQKLVVARGLNDLVSTSVITCTAGRYCLVELTDLSGKRLDLLETERVTGELEAERAAQKDAGQTAFRAFSRNFLKYAQATPNDEYYNFQWHYAAANIPTAWDYTVGDESIVVAVIDSGLRTDHVDIQGRYVAGADLIIDPTLAQDGDGRDQDARDPGDLQFGEVSSWHGTHVSGTIAASTNNQIGVAGIMWQGKVMPVRVLGLQGSGTDFDIVSGIFYAVGDPEVEGVTPTTTPAKILNISIGGPSSPEAQAYWEDAVAVLTGPNAAPYGNPLLVVAAGNEGGNVSNSTPANIDGVIAVGAHDYLGNLSPYSNYGSKITIMAPGGNTDQDANQDQLPDGVLSLFETQYNFIHGTSMATPHVAGILGLVVSLQPDITQAEAITLLRSYANPSGQCTEGCGAGWVDATALVIGSGAQPEALPRLASDAQNVVFQPGDIRRQVVLRNTGGADLQWTGDISGAQGALFALQTSSGTIFPGETQTIEVQLNRGDFEAGSANLNIDGVGEANGQAIRIDLAFADIAPPPKVALQRIQVQLYTVRADNSIQPTNNVYIARPPNFEYRFEDLEPGGYQIFAVADDNDDEIFDPQRESVGAYPLVDNVETFTVESQTQYTSINFGLSGGFVIGAVGDVGAPCLGDGDCDFSDDAECIIDTTWPSGYCTRICTDDGRCNGGSCESFDVCGEAQACGLCMKACVTASQCRFGEGYVCDDFGTCSPPGVQ